jgi:large subunit ribosomal protein L16
MRPKKLKFAKVFKNVSTYKLSELKCIDLDVGIIGLKSLMSGRVRNKEMEVVKKGIRRVIKRRGKVFLKFFPSRGLTRKAVGVRMGKGKGNIAGWFGDVKKGKIMYELKGSGKKVGRSVLSFYKKRLPLLGRIVVYKV